MATTNIIQTSAVHHDAIGSPREKCTTAAITPAPAGIGIPTKYFLPGRPGLEGCGLLLMLKRARRLAPAIRNRKLAIAPNCSSLAPAQLAQIRRQLPKSPRPRQQCGRDTKGDDIRQRVQFPAKIAAGPRHACNSAVQTVKHHGKANGLGGIVKMQGVGDGGMRNLQNRLVPKGNIGSGKK